MRVTVTENTTRVEWNDDGTACQIYAGGPTIYVESEQMLRDLYECLGFIFGKS